VFLGSLIEPCAGSACSPSVSNTPYVANSSNSYLVVQFGIILGQPIVTVEKESLYIRIKRLSVRIITLK